ncbi:MAG: ATP-grasp domain-containing protein [Acidobacteria bacterium]|nr:ATP-grasp domain-containing protein [Acidobacteriota bacterium]
MRICFLMEDRGPGYVHPVMSVVFELLRARGCAVDWYFPERRVFSLDDLKIEHDLYVLKSSSLMTYQVGGILAAKGARMINSFAAVQRIKNKVEINRLLRDHDVPVPDAYLTGDIRQLQSALVTKGPLIAKPYRGRHGLGVVVIRGREELERVRLPEGCVYAEAFKAGDGEDRKVYVVGDRVYASKKRFASGESFLNHAQELDVTPEMREIALRCGAIVGLQVYGVDMIQADDGLWVIDVNGFPGFKGIAGVESVLADHLYNYARSGS